MIELSTYADPSQEGNHLHNITVSENHLVLYHTQVTTAQWVPLIYVLPQRKGTAQPHYQNIFRRYLIKQIQQNVNYKI